MKNLVLAATLSVMATAAFAQSTAEKTGVNSLVGIPPKTEDFVGEAAMSDMFEIASSKLAVERADAQTKAFAEQMVSDHQKTTSELKQLVEGGAAPVALPMAMSSAQQDMLAELQKLQGDDFIKKYHEYQEDAHEDAVDLFQRYGKEGDNAELKTWAAKTLPALEHHLQMAKDLNK